MEKNQANKWVVFAYGLPDHANPGEAITGDAANITANIRIDGGGANAVDDTNPTELEDGYYIFDITAAESNGDNLLLTPASSTGNVQVIAVPGAVWTRPAYFNVLGIESDGDLTKVNTLDGHTAQTGDNYARIGANGAGLSNIDLPNQTMDIVGDITGNLSGSVGSVTSKTGYSLSSTGLDAISQAATGMVEIAKAIWDRALTGATHNIPTSAGRRLRQSTGIIMTDGTAQAGGTNSITLAAGESSTDNLFWQSYVAIVAGTGAGQGHHIVTYNGTTKVATIDDDWTVAPDATSEYIIYGSGSHEAIEEGTPTAVTNGTITLNTFSPSADDQLKHLFISIISGTGNRQVRRITAYNGTTKVATLDSDWTTNPDTSSGYWIFSGGLTVNDIWDEPLTGATHNVPTSSGRRLRQLSVVPFLEGTVVDATATTTVIETSLTGYGDSFFSDTLFLVELSAGEWQSRAVTNYSSVTGEFTFDEAFGSAPANGVNIAVQVTHVHPVSEIQLGLATEAKQDATDIVIGELTTQGDTNETKLDTLTTQVGTAGAGLTDLGGMSTGMKAEVNAEADTALSDYGANTVVPDAAGTAPTKEEIRIEMDDNSTQLNTTLPALIDDLAIKKNTAGLLHIEMVLTSDHVTPATGLTVTAQRLIDNGTYASVSGAMTEISNGTYRFDYLAADANGDTITWRFSAGIADDTKVTFRTVA